MELKHADQHQSTDSILKRKIRVQLLHKISYAKERLSFITYFVYLIRQILWVFAQPISKKTVPCYLICKLRNEDGSSYIKPISTLCQNEGIEILIDKEDDHIN